MVTASVHHSILVIHVIRLQTQTRRKANFSFCCMNEEKQPITTSSSHNPPPTTTTNTQLATPSFPPLRATPRFKMNTKFIDLLAFSGPAPERIDGRLSIIGFVDVMGVEVTS
ncbi:hypothetical protein MKX01_032947 [Papaver californicum]|nr:hypothetical protein MKX01_032947 [Papaver californicum]